MAVKQIGSYTITDAHTIYGNKPCKMVTKNGQYIGDIKDGKAFYLKPEKAKNRIQGKSLRRIIEKRYTEYGKVKIEKLPPLLYKYFLSGGWDYDLFKY